MPLPTVTLGEPYWLLGKKSVHQNSGGNRNILGANTPLGSPVFWELKTSA